MNWNEGNSFTFEVNSNSTEAKFEIHHKQDNKIYAFTNLDLKSVAE